MARTLSVDELLDRAEAQVRKEYPNSNPAEVLEAIMRYRRPSEAAKDGVEPKKESTVL